ncbi:MAG: T9SS type A sorting domain-containing protein [Bacteroidia bacterium]
MIDKNQKTVLALNNLNTNNLPIDINHLNQGVYFISGVSNQGTFVQKIVLVHSYNFICIKIKRLLKLT